MQESVHITGPKGYLIWLAANQPQIYARVRDRLRNVIPASALAGFGADPLTAITLDTSLISDPVINAAPEGASSSWADTLGNILKTVAVGYSTKQQVDAQKQLTAIQLDRIRQGLPPVNVDPTKLGLSTATVGVGLTSGTQNFLMLGGAALLGVLLLKGRRSHA